MSVYTQGQEGDLAFVVPDESCCNCGAADDISLVSTPLKKTRYMLLGGTELQFNINLPYCSECARTATRFRIGIMGKVLLAFGLFWVLMLGVIALPNKLATLLPGSFLPLSLGAAALLLTFGFYRLHRATPPQTSYYQPVFLADVKQKFSGDVIGLSLGFSNPSYATQFESRNRGDIESGNLNVVRL